MATSKLAMRIRDGLSCVCLFGNAILGIICISLTVMTGCSSFDKHRNDDVISEFNQTYSSQSDVVRVNVGSGNAGIIQPLQVVVRETSAILSWQVPLVLEKTRTYNLISRTLCPVNVTQLSQSVFDGFVGAQKGYSYQTPLLSDANANGSLFFVELSTASPVPVFFNLTAVLLPKEYFELELHIHRSLDISPSQPVFLHFIFPSDSDIDSVVVEVRSESYTCMVVSIQPIECPVFDLDNNVAFAGTYQTVSKLGAMTITRAELPEFYVVFVVKADDLACSSSNMRTIIKPEDKYDPRIKTIDIVIKPAGGSTKYWIAIFVAIACCLAVCALVICLSFVFYMREKKDPKYIEARDAVVVPALEGNSAERQLLSNARQNQGRSYGAIQQEQPEQDDHSADHAYHSPTAVSTVSSRSTGRNRRKTKDGSAPTASANHDESNTSDEYDSDYDRLEDASVDKNIVRSKANLCVADLARKSFNTMHRKYGMYQWNLLTLSIFYLLPVVQLVLTYQTVVQTTGRTDICYYNFLCMRKVWKILAFNNVISNIGYVFLGMLMLVLVYNRDVAHQKLKKLNFEAATKYGIPQHYGIFYAIGTGLVVEGFLSACYHICPNYSNFQFDTAFMYMIAVLGLLRIYQARHPDVSAHSHVAYCLMALVIFLAVVGTVYNDTAFWVVFSISYIFLIFIITAEFYYKGRWRIDKGIFSRIKREVLSSTCRNWFIPTYKGRFFFLILVNLMNVGLIAFGLYKRPKEFPSYLVAVFIGNLMLYTVFYISMKMRHRERILARPLIYILISSIVWGFGLYFYFDSPTSWMLSPAQSRVQNQECILLDFYDKHDVWHFLSAVSLFFSFMVLLTIDDDLWFVHQEKIVVF